MEAAAVPSDPRRASCRRQGGPDRRGDARQRGRARASPARPSITSRARPASRGAAALLLRHQGAARWWRSCGASARSAASCCEQAVAGAAGADELIDALVRSFEEILGEGPTRRRDVLRAADARASATRRSPPSWPSWPGPRGAARRRAAGAQRGGRVRAAGRPGRRRRLPARARRRRHRSGG